MTCGLLGTLDLSFPHVVHLEMIMMFETYNIKTGLETFESQKLSNLFVILHKILESSR